MHYRDDLVDALPAITEERLKMRWAEARFRARVLTAACFDRFWARVMAGTEGSLRGYGPCVRTSTLVVMGGAMFGSTIHGVTGPTVAAEAAARRAAAPGMLRFVDEHRTSRTCAACGSLLQVCRMRTTAPRTVRARVPGLAAQQRRVVPVGTVLWLRGLRRCCNARCAQHGQFVDRDVNGALNIGARWLGELLGIVHNGRPRVPAHLRPRPPGRRRPLSLRSTAETSRAWRSCWRATRRRRASAAAAVAHAVRCAARRGARGPQARAAPRPACNLAARDGA